MERVLMNDDQLDTVSGGSILPYQVQQGDSLGAIAKKFNCSVEDLIRWNNIQNPNIITVGQQLKVKF